MEQNNKIKKFNLYYLIICCIIYIHVYIYIYKTIKLILKIKLCKIYNNIHKINEIKLYTFYFVGGKLKMGFHI